MYDGRGSVAGAVNQDGIMTSYAYTAYGELMPDSPTPKVFGYNAEATDYDTGLQYLRARYYSTDIQRFVQEDDYRGKFTRPASMNRYAYTYNNPVMGIDPSGYEGVSFTWAFFAGLGLADDPEQIGVLWGAAISLALYWGGLLIVNLFFPGFGLLAKSLLNAAATFVGNVIGQIITSNLRGDDKHKINWVSAIGDALLAGLLGAGGKKLALLQGNNKIGKFVAKILSFVFTDAIIGIFDVTMTGIGNKKRAEDKEEFVPEQSIAENSSPCEPNYRYDAYDDELDVLYSQLNKLESNGCTAATTAVNQKIKSVEKEKEEYIDTQIKKLNNQIDILDGVGALSAINAIKEEISKLEEDKELIENKITKKEKPKSSKVTSQGVKRKAKDFRMVGRFSKPLIEAY